jgi:carbonic anhydrase/acetyltransferase-like protein (isoleucine patch superfamily)
MIRPYLDRKPQLGEGAFVAPGADVIGNVVIGVRASIWYGCVLRGDDPVESIRIGAESNIQDLSVIHIDTGGFSTVVGERVTVGHRVVLHGCKVGDLSLIGIGSILLNGSEIGSESLIGAGSLVTPGTKIPPRVLALGSPCRVKRPLTDAELNELRESAKHYVHFAQQHLRPF